jgi:hypothetical protein
MQYVTDHPRRAGFTLVEALVSLGVIAVVIALTLPALRSVRSNARSAECLSNLRQSGLLTELVANDNGDLFPFWVSNLPASPPIGRLGLSDTYDEVRSGARCFICPADPAGRDAGIEYSSYIYGPGSSIMRELSRREPESAIRFVSARYRRNNWPVFADRTNAWHGGMARNVVSLPDLHAKVWQDR